MRYIVMVIAVCAWASSVDAQRGGSGRGTDSVRWTPTEMDRRIQERMGQLLREQLGLTDAQVRQMREHNVRFGARRMALGRDERAARQSLRDVMRLRDSAPQADVGTFLDRVIALQGERVALLGEEQRALAVFLTPIQRARYFAFEEELMRRSEEMRRAAESHGGSGGRGPGAADGRRPPPPPPPPQARRVPPPESLMR
jgi:hypothetical protein